MPVMRIIKSNVDKRAVHDPGNGAAATFYFDDVLKGFGIKITPAGHKSYFAQYRDGKGRRAEKVRQVIGEHGSPWTPDTARDEADKIIARAKLGSAPIREIRVDKAAMTVAELCEQYMKEAKAGVPMGRRGRPKKAITLRYDRGRIGRHIIPLLGKKLVKNLTTPDVQHFVNAVTAGKTAVELERSKDNSICKHGRVRVEGGAGTAARAVELLGGIMSYAKGLGICDRNPVEGITKARSQVRDRWLTADEFKRLGKAMGAAAADGTDQKWIDAIRLIALTGARRQDVQALMWRDVDIEGQALRLSDSKTGKSTRPLGKLAADLLSARAANKADEAFVFPAHTKVSKPMSGLNKVCSAIAAKAGLADVTPHTLRHSLATHANDMGFAEPTIAAILGHKRHSVTSRYTHMIDKTLIAAADKIADRIARMLDGRSLEDIGQVVELRRA